MKMPIPDEKIISNIDARIKEFRGQIPALEQAIGVWIIGRKFGWKVMFLVHHRKDLG